MTEVIIKIKSGNAVLSGDKTTAEIARILSDIVDQMLLGNVGNPIMDINGNTVGYWWIDTDEWEDED
jgi:hypothetical protein